MNKMSVLSNQLCIFSLIIAHLCMAFASLPSDGHYPTITVDQSGHGNYQTIQAAIDSVPPYNKDWICINIKDGTYREQVNIPVEKPYIYLKGSRNTNVIWDGHATIQNATFISEADNIVIKAMSFINSYNYPPEKTKNPREVAVAGMLVGDKILLYKCTFKSWQDTLWDTSGRHYFKRCTIVGAVDFIFGKARSIYESCSVEVNAGALEHGWPGYITANGRESSEDMSGFVFKNCRVFGNGKTYLGRPWRDYATVIFYQTFMKDIIVPEGWNNTFALINATGPTIVPDADVKTLTFAEYGCSGKGSDQSKRVPWLAKLSDEQLNWYTNLSYIDSDGWLERQPFIPPMLP